MKKSISLILILTMICSLSAGCNNTQESAGQNDMGWDLQDTQNYYGDILGKDKIIDINVEMSEEDWTDLCENATQENYYPADITVNGTKLTNVGFRTKGFSSLTTVANSTSNRYGFKVKTDEYVKNQTLNGLDMFVLNGSFADASYMREYLTYAACEKLGMITPFLTYINLYLNGELFGFYVMIEAYDDSFVERNTNDKNAVLYKASEETCTLLESDDCTGFDIDYGDDDGFENIKSLISTLNSTTSDNKDELEAILNVDSALKAWAVNTVLGNYDSYSGSKAHNYYLLYSNGRFEYIGWDYNMSIGGFSEDNGASVTVDVTEPLYNAQEAQRPLISKLLSIDEYYQKYISYVEELCGYFENIEDITEWISGQISEYVKNDPSAFYTYDEHITNITKSDEDLSTRTSIGMAAPGRPSAPNSDEIPTMPEGDFDPSQINPGGAFDPNSGDIPTMPEGDFDPSQMNPGGTFDPDSGEIPTMPSGDFDTSQVSPGGTFDPNGGGQQQFPGFPGGDGMMSTTTVSVVDYILQRIENIKAQLDADS